METLTAMNRVTKHLFLYKLSDSLGLFAPVTELNIRIPGIIIFKRLLLQNRLTSQSLTCGASTDLGDKCLTLMLYLTRIPN